MEENKKCLLVLFDNTGNRLCDTIVRFSDIDFELKTLQDYTCFNLIDRVCIFDYVILNSDSDFIPDDFIILYSKVVHTGYKKYRLEYL